MSHSDETLLARADAVAARAYAPYSRFRVGAAVRDADGAVFVGCNVENASYGLTICAERAAIFAALAAGARRPLGRLALTCLDAAGANGCTPCGACRQILWELAGDIDRRDFTMSVALRRIRDHGDLFGPVLEGGQALDRAMATLRASTLA